MSKLNAEWCKNHIESMKANGMSLLEEKYLSALEIALPILEQQERGEGDWVDWHGKCRGNDQPVIGMVEVKFRNGKIEKSEACDLYWPHDGIASDIIAYRIIPEHPKNQKGEQQP